LVTQAAEEVKTAAVVGKKEAHEKEQKKAI
jgi:hypothetical protein